MNDFLTSVIRTFVPILAGFVITYLTSRGVKLDAEFNTNLILLLQASITGLYYFVVRLLERKFPRAGILLGSQKTPEYTVQSVDIVKKALPRQKITVKKSQ